MAVTRQYGIKDETTGQLEYIDIGAKAKNILLEDGSKLTEYIISLENYKNQNDQTNQTQNEAIQALEEKNFYTILTADDWSFKEPTTIILDRSFLETPYITFESQYGNIALESKRIYAKVGSTYTFSYNFFKDETEELLTMDLTFLDETNIKITNLKERIISIDADEESYVSTLYSDFNFSFLFSGIVGNVK